MIGQFSRVGEAWLDRLVQAVVRVSSHAVLWPRPVKRGFVMAADALLCVLATWAAFSLRLGEWRLLDWPVVRFTLSMLVLWFPIAIYRGIYKAIFRYAGRGAVISLTLAVALMTVPLVIFYTFHQYPGVPRTLALLGPLMFLAAMTLARIVGRYILIDLFHSRPGDRMEESRVLIYGAGSLGQRLAASLAAEKGMRLVGYIDDDQSKHLHRLDGAPVWHSSRIGEAIERTGTTDVLLAMSDIGRRRKREIFDSLDGYDVEVRALPPMREMIAGRVTVSDLRPVQVEDLLGRAPVAPDEALLRAAVSGRRVMVTGAGGSIGSEICRQVLELGPSVLILVEASEFALFAVQQELEGALTRQPAEGRPMLVSRLVNVADRRAVDRLFAAASPQTVFHAAAYKHVPLVEDNPISGIENNLVGTMNCALAARGSGTERFILISTDKAVRPPNVMGATKRACEMLLQALDDQDTGSTIFAMVRFGNVLGSSGSVVPLFRRQIAEGGPVTVTHRDVTRYFMTIPEAAQLVIQAGGMAEGGEVFVLDMGEPVRIWDLATSMIRLAGLSVREQGSTQGDIEIVERGLRPGEKLYEELLIGDDPLPTSHRRIMRARESFLPYGTLMTHFDALLAAVGDNDPDAARDALRILVPTLAGAEAVSPETEPTDRTAAATS